MNKTVQVMAIFCCVGLLAAACSSSESGQSTGNGSDSGSQQTSSALGASRSEPQKPQVIEDVDYSGIGSRRNRRSLRMWTIPASVRLSSFSTIRTLSLSPT